MILHPRQLPKERKTSTKEREKKYAAFQRLIDVKKKYPNKIEYKLIGGTTVGFIIVMLSLLFIIHVFG